MPTYDGPRSSCSSLLEEMSNVPMIAKEMDLILAVQIEDFWQDITSPSLESLRRRLRELIKLIEVKRRPIVYTDFEDEIGASTEVELRGVDVGTHMDRSERRRGTS